MVKEMHDSFEHRHRKCHVSAGVQAIALFPWETCRDFLNAIISPSQYKSVF